MGFMGLLSNFEKKCKNIFSRDNADFVKMTYPTNSSMTFHNLINNTLAGGLFSFRLVSMGFGGCHVWDNSGGCPGGTFRVKNDLKWLKMAYFGP